MKYFFNDVNFNDAKVAMNGWVNELKDEYYKRTGIHIDFAISYIDDINILISDIKSKKLDVVVVSSYDYLALDINLYSAPIMMDNPDDKLVKVLLVNKNSNATSINDLKLKRLSVEPGIDGIFSNYWLNMITKQNGIDDYNNFFTSINTCKKHNMVIMDLFFNKSDAAITSLSSYLTNCEMNNQIKEKIKIIAKSEILIYSIVSLRKDCNSINGKILTEIATNTKDNKAMKNMMELFRKTKVIPYRDDLLMPVKNLTKSSNIKILKEIKKNKGKTK
jgi:ABC-type phosphate/phosphonate transport system substrate-binding protein